uniref:Intraflagellar transport protein 56 n=1 Tax=Plectus sambesii TaxID=2011161 RepID=A0A914VKT0_9BILA
MLLSRLRPAKKKQEAAAAAAEKLDKKKKIPELQEYLDKRDYAGAMSLLQFQQKGEKNDLLTDLWLGHCAFHAGDYKKASETYEWLLSQKECPPEVFIYLGCCFFFLGMYSEAKETADKGPKSSLQNRLLFHVSHKLNDEKNLMQHHSKLQDTMEDQLSLASIHYLRSHYQEAIDIYKRILLNNRNFIALNVYLALCYYKLDYYDVSLEVLQVYLQQHPDSATAVNLRACNHFKLYNGKAAENELKTLQDQTTPSFQFAKDLIKHNMTVFRNGETALQVLPPLVDVLPEARLNLIIYHLKRDDVQAAFQLTNGLEPSTPNEYLLKATVHCIVGQQQMSKEHLKTSEEFYRMVGSSAAECDTIPGRQSMASAHFLMRQFEEVLVYLNSIKTYFYNEDTFNYNYGQALTACGNYKEAEEVLLGIKDDKLKNDYTYTSTLARCYIMNKKARLAWDLYLKMETSSESFSLLQLVANDCYKMGQFYYSAKAFDVLERLDPNPEYWEGKRGASVGVFQLVIAQQEGHDSLRDVVQMLQNASHPQVEYLVRVMRKWARENKISAL